MQHKKRGSFLQLKLVMAFLLLTVLFAGGFYIGMTAINSYRADYIRATADAIDRSLYLYGLSHNKIDTSTITVDTDPRIHESIKSKQKKIYPKSLSEINVVQAKFGYLSNMISFTETIPSNDLSGHTFTYTPILDSDGDCIAYNLRVLLPNGYTYLSPGSKDYSKVKK